MNLRQIQDIAGHRDVPPWVVKLVQDCIEHDRTWERDQQQDPVARLDGVDEYGPILCWHKNWVDIPVGAKLYTTQPTSPNLNCKSVQRRLATSWGYVRKEEYDMARVAAATSMRDAAVKVCDDLYKHDRKDSGYDEGWNDALGVAENLIKEMK